MSFIIALAGNPNSGKTTLFNELTGSTAYVGNWPGVTVEKKEGKLKGCKDITIVDLPGIYSLSPYSPEEVISRDFIIKQKPDAILNIIDSSNLERNLYLTLQLKETDVPVIAALNMIDVIKKKGESIDAAKLSQKLGCPVIETSASKGQGIKELTDEIIKLKCSPRAQKRCSYYDKKFEEAVTKTQNIICGSVQSNIRWHAIKLLENDEKIKQELKLSDEITAQIKQIMNELENYYDDDCDSIITDLRYKYITASLKDIYNKKSSAVSVTEKIDRIVTNRYLALPIFILVILGVYLISIQTVGSLTVELMESLFSDVIASGVNNWLTSINAASWLKGLIVDGIIGGVGMVLVFVPQLMMLFLLLSFLEDCGYMSRIAFILDRIFRHFGLSGKSFIPMLIGTGCTVPGITATRTIENEKDRRMTIMLTPFIPCGAKLPVFALISGAIFPNLFFIAPSMYFAGIIMVIISGILLKRTRLFKGDISPFVMEMPQYRLPNAKGLLIHMWDRSKDFIVKAGTVIFTASAIIWVLVSFNWSFVMTDTQHSMLSSIGRVIAPVLKPLGFGNWQSAVAILTGFVAKENIVATFGIVLNSGIENPAFAEQISFLFDNPAAAYAFMILILFAPPCIAAISTIKREMNSAKWTFIALGFQIVVSYIAAFLVYQIGSMLFYDGSPLTSTILAGIIVLYIAYITYKRIKAQKSCAGSCAYCNKCKK